MFKENNKLKVSHPEKNEVSQQRNKRKIILDSQEDAETPNKKMNKENEISTATTHSITKEGIYFNILLFIYF
jgi:hypothetical protein